MPKTPESERVRLHAHYLANRARFLERSREFRLANPDSNAKNSRQYRLNNLEVERERCRAKESRRRAQKKGSLVHEEVVPLVVLERDDGMCGICLKDVDPTDFHVDHIVSLANGGDHSYSNTQVAHPLCNLRKGARDES
jgi:5-methylcytosine-specific restriction endonuclease McrA